MPPKCTLVNDAAMTVKEFTDKMSSRISDLEKEYKPLLYAAESFKADAAARIWEQSLNSNGSSLLSVSGYSTTPMYSSAKSLPRKTGNNKGKTGKPIQSEYFSGGYAQMKAAVGRPPAELFGTLRSDFASSPVILNGSKVVISVSRNESAEKVVALEKKWGEMFQPTEQELQDIVDTVLFETLKYLNE